jgi:hypothetical protein
VEKRPYSEILKALEAPLPDEMLEPKTMGGQKIWFVSWDNMVRVLDDRVPEGWDYTVRIESVGSDVVVIASIAIQCSEGVRIRESTGSKDEDDSGYGGPAYKAESAALRRAASKHHCGLYLYDLKHPDHPKNKQGSQQTQGVTGGVGVRRGVARASGK